jgi:two-component system CheB/CheR fusion protein
VEDLSRLNNDMNNLLDASEAATVFLDGALRVRLFTAASKRILKLIPGDVGRPITDIASDLSYPELADDAREVLRTLVFHQQQVAARDGRWFTLRIVPYRTLDNKIDGLVLTLAEITASKTLEADLRLTQAGLEKRIAEQDVKLGSVISDQCRPCGEGTNR